MEFCGKCDLGWIRVERVGWNDRVFDALARCECNPQPGSPKKHWPPKHTKTRVEVRGERVCFCGAAKRQGLNLCRDCWLALPADLRKGLWSKEPRVWKAAFGRAKRFLDKLIREGGMELAEERF